MAKRGWRFHELNENCPLPDIGQVGPRDSRTSEKSRPGTKRKLDRKREKRPTEPGVYFIEGGDMGVVKIGYTVDRVGRIGQLASSNPMWLRFIGWVPCETTEHAQEIERALHRNLKASGRRHIRGEWYRLTSADLRLLIEFAKGRSLELAIEDAA